MTTWVDLLEMLTLGNSSVALLCTATTGLHRTDKVLAVSYVLFDGDIEAKEETFFLDATAEELAPAQQYHHISPDIMLSNGMPKDAFQEKLTELLTKRTVFTYNAPFQEKALVIMNGGIIDTLPCSFMELPLWIKAAESKLHFIVDLPLGKAESQIANRIAAPTWKRMLEYRGISPTAPPGMLPVVYNAQCLKQLYRMLIEQPPDIELAL